LKHVITRKNTGKRKVSQIVHPSDIVTSRINTRSQTATDSQAEADQLGQEKCLTTIPNSVPPVNKDATNTEPTVTQSNDPTLRKKRRKGTQSVAPPVGDPGFGDAPDYLCTKVVTIYQQHSNPYCLSHSLASALFYCDSRLFRLASEGLVDLGKSIAGIHFDAQIKHVRDYMENHVPILGRPTLFGRRPNTHLRKLRHISWDELLLNITPFPTLVIPKLPSGRATHAFCVVDDLIFDSTTPTALKLCRDAVKWLFGETFPEMYQVIRFNGKVSPKGYVVSERYVRPIQYHWDHPSRSTPSVLNTMEVK